MDINELNEKIEDIGSMADKLFTQSTINYLTIKTIERGMFLLADEIHNKKDSKKFKSGYMNTLMSEIYSRRDELSVIDQTAHLQIEDLISWISERLKQIEKED